MSRAAIRCITGRQFNTVSNPEMLETIFQSVNSTKRTPLRLGPGLSRMLLQRQVDHSDVIHALIATIKVLKETKHVRLTNVVTDPCSMDTCATSGPIRSQFFSAPT